MDRAYALKGSFGSLDVFKSRLVTLGLRCGLATRVLDKELDIVHVYIGDLDSVRRILVNLSLSNSIWTLNLNTYDMFPKVEEVTFLFIVCHHIFKYKQLNNLAGTLPSS